MRILVIEDNIELSKNIKEYFRLEKFAVDTAEDGYLGLEKASNEEYDCIILDLNLPKLDGVELCRRLRQEGNNTPVLMLTARTGTANIISGLNTGADDYITKPFELEELVARVKSLIRRDRQLPNPVVNVQDITIDTNARQVTQKGNPIQLSPKEYSLLEYLALHPNQVQERVVLIEHVWGEYDELMFSQTVDVHISYLRKKLGKNVITTVHGGYMIKSENK